LSIAATKSKVDLIKKDLLLHPGSMCFEIAKRIGMKTNDVGSFLHRLTARGFVKQYNGGFYLEQ
jgi:DNA-binding IclR family transcriptional regulator